MSFKFQVRLAGRWVDYPERADKKICAAYKTGKKEVSFQLKVGTRKNDYVLDFAKMCQISMETNKARPVRAPYDLLKKFNAEAMETVVENPELAGDDVSETEISAKGSPRLELDEGKIAVEKAIDIEMKNITSWKRFAYLEKAAQKEKCSNAVREKAKMCARLVADLENALEGKDIPLLLNAARKVVDNKLTGPLIHRVPDRKKEIGFAKARTMITTLMQETAVIKGKPLEKLEEMRRMTLSVIKEAKALGLGEEEVRPARDRARKIHNAVQDLKGAIRVFCRTRPFDQREKDHGSKNCLTFRQDRMTIALTDDDGYTQSFFFDNTFNPGKQCEIFEEMSELIQSAFDGYNVTVFAYGQTGSGKTFTMYGPEPNPTDDAGVVLRSIDEIYAQKDAYAENFDVTISLQMIELYCSRLVDLLHRDAMKGPKLGVRKTADGEVLIENASTKISLDSRSLWKNIENGFKTRQVAETAMNSNSSRSHCIVIVHLHLVNKSTKQVIRSKVTLVDLAGSERVKDSNVEGEALKEAIEINKSLTALGDVMEQVTSGGKNIGYRNHLLTQILQDSLGGSAKTIMFANISPASINHSETVMTLKWATRAKHIVNDGVNLRREKSSASPSKKRLSDLAMVKQKLKEKTKAIIR